MKYEKIKLKKFSNNKNKKMVVLVISIILCIAMAGVFIFESYALYQNDQTYNVLKGKVGDHWYDVKVAIVVDEEQMNAVPTERKGSNGKYYSVTTTCNMAGTSAEWDYNAWNLELNNLQENTKCNVEFVSNLSQADYQKYIDAGIALRRNTYRGKNITGYYNDGSLYTMIGNGTFDDIYVGDYIVANNITWLIADIDNYLHTGDVDLYKHHATIIPAKPLENSGMNSTDTTSGGYMGSEMVTGNVIDETKVTLTLPAALEQYIIPAFGNHVLSYRNMLTNIVDTTLISPGYSKWTGVASDWKWYDRKLDLMSEVNVYGTNIWSSSGYDTGIDNHQYAIFQLRPEFINSYEKARFHYWLKNVSSLQRFSHVDVYAISNGTWSSQNLRGVRPRFLIG